jgi:steroid delta-isomerase
LTTVATPEQMRTAFEQYTARLTAGDGDGVASLFADDAWIEDPLGAAKHVGRDDILKFYRGAVERAHPEVRLTGPVRVSSMNEAAAPMQSRSNFGGSPKEIDIIDVFTFDDDGLITSMRAYWGEGNLRDRQP